MQYFYRMLRSQETRYYKVQYNRAMTTTRMNRPRRIRSNPLTARDRNFIITCADHNPYLFHME